MAKEAADGDQPPSGIYNLDADKQEAALKEWRKKMDVRVGWLPSCLGAFGCRCGWAGLRAVAYLVLEQAEGGARRRAAPAALLADLAALPSPFVLPVYCRLRWRRATRRRRRSRC